MRARLVVYLVAWCACASTAPADSNPTLQPTTCSTLMLNDIPPLPQTAKKYALKSLATAKALSKLIDLNEANEMKLTALAQEVATRNRIHIPAVALSAPQLHLGILYITQPARVYIYEKNTTAGLQPFWNTLVSVWNSSETLWSPGWFSCDADTRGWWSAVSATDGIGPSKAAAALFLRHQHLPCEDAMNDWLGGPPLCDSKTMLCDATVAPPSYKHKLKYHCSCRPGHRLHPTSDPTTVESETRVAIKCTACGIGGSEFECFSEEYQVVLLAINLTGIMISFAVALIIFKKRKCKVVAMGMWTVLEVILLGIILMFTSAASQYIKDAWLRCIIGAWFRELGFVATYGSVVLRLWVLLAEFRTRKAHRWTPRDAEVLKIVGAMLLGAICYLSAFTATSACESLSVSCSASAWHHVTAAAELLLLAVGVRIAFAVRNANVPFQERTWLATSLCLEAISGIAMRVMALAGMAPELSALSATIRANMSSGFAMYCVLAPRLWHVYRSRYLGQEFNPQKVSRRGVVESLNAEGEEEPSSEEVRAELKRLYVQLEILRNKTIRRDNPHISKRRGGRKPPHRRFSLQALQARRGAKGKSSSNAEPSEGQDASRTPEDSVCSMEGPSNYTDGDNPA